MAEHHTRQIRLAQPDGPYMLAGHSFGGLVAFEIARRLSDGGATSGFLGLIDPQLPLHALTWRERLSLLSNLPGWLARSPYGSARRVVRQSLAHGLPPAGRSADWANIETLRQTGRRARSAYRPRPFEAKATLFRASHRSFHESVPAWRRLVGELSVVDVDGDHGTILRDPLVAQLGKSISLTLAAVPSAAGNHGAQESPVGGDAVASRDG